MSSVNLMFLYCLYYGLLYPGSCFVPSPTNISVVCQNSVNVLYWNYSKPAERLTFLVTVKPYSGMGRTFSTSQTYLNITEYSSSFEDHYFVAVGALDGQEVSNNVSNKFTYNKDFVDEDTHACSVDFPTISTVVHKDEISVSFLNPYNPYMKESLENEFKYKITYDQHESEHYCSEDEELCTAKIHLEESLAGKCVKLKFEGMVTVLLTTLSKDVCVSEITDASLVENPNYIVAMVSVVLVILFILMGFMWLLYKKWSKISKMPEVLIGFMYPQKSPTATHTPVTTTEVSTVSPMGHTPLLEQPQSEALESPTVLPPEEQKTFFPTDTEVEILSEALAQEDVNFEEPEDCSTSFGYNSPKFLQEMSPGDFTTGYGPRPPVL